MGVEIHLNYWKEYFIAHSTALYNMYYSDLCKLLGRGLFRWFLFFFASWSSTDWLLDTKVFLGQLIWLLFGQSGTRSGLQHNTDDIEDTMSANKKSFCLLSSSYYFIFDLRTKCMKRKQTQSISDARSTTFEHQNAISMDETSQYG